MFKQISSKMLVALLTIPLVSVMLACFALSTPVRALQTIPYKMNFQGRITDSSGNALANGNYNMKLRIYDSLTGGVLQWNEQRANSAATGVTVTNGLFSIQLGDVTSLPSSIFSNPNLYFEIELPTPATATCTTSSCESYTEGPMGPRNKLGSSAYAFNSDTLDGIDSTGFIQNTTTIQPGNIAIQSAAAANVGIAMRAAASQTGDLLQFQNSSGASMSLVDRFGRIVFGATAAIQGAGISLQTSDPTQQGVVVRGLAGQTAQLFDVQNSGGTNLLSVGGAGGVSVTTSTDMTNALTVTNSAGFNIANIDTAAGAVSLGRTAVVGGLTVGHTPVGASTDTGENLGVSAARFQTGATAGATGSISVNVGGAVDASPNNKFKMAVYADNAGVPGALVAQTAESSLTAGWNTLTLSATLSPTTFYWFAYATNASASTSNNMTYDTAGSSYFLTNTYASGFPGTLTGGTTNTRNFSMYVTFASANVSALSIDGNGRVGIGTTTPTHKVDIAGDVQIVTPTNSTTAFRLQSSTNANIFVADTTNARFYIGDPTPDANTVFLVVDNSSVATDPAGTNGAIYYNTAMSRFRCYESGAWKNCTDAAPANISTVASSALTAGSANYLAGSSITLPVGGLVGPTSGAQNGATVTWRLSMSKTAAGTTASTFSVVLGTAGTTADTVRCTPLNTGTGTAAIDWATVTITAFVTAGGTTATLNCSGTMAHSNTTTGFSTAYGVSGYATATSFDSTPSGTKIGLTMTPGTSSVITIQNIQTTVTGL